MEYRVVILRFSRFFLLLQFVYSSFVNLYLVFVVCILHAVS